MDKLNTGELISIIVPVYNVEKYLERCVDSLIRQTYRNIEIILVDDGAKDQSGKICDEYALKDERIKVIHKENGGLSDARNAGINVAIGKLIGFVDSDDYVSVYMYEELINCINKTNADISICGYCRFEGEKCTEASENFEGIVEMDTLRALKELNNDDGEYLTVAWNKLYRREVISDIRYPLGRINEDEFTTYKFITNAKKIAITKKQLYYYFYNGNSITTKSNYLSNMDIYDAFDERISYLNQKGYKQLEGRIQKQYLNRVISRNSILYKRDKEEAQKLLGIYRKRYKSVKKMVKGIGYKIYRISPRLYYFLVEIRKR